MHQGRPREFDIDRALEAATRQFWSVGYEATSLADLLQAMKLSKSSLYQTFGNKEALFIRCLEHYQQTVAADLQDRLRASHSPRQFLRDFLEGVIAEADKATGRKGCLLVNTANELAQRMPAVKLAVNRGTERMAGIFAEAITTAIERGEIAPSPAPAEKAGYFICAVSGLRTMVKSGATRSDLEPVLNLVMLTLG